MRVLCAVRVRGMRLVLCCECGGGGGVCDVRVGGGGVGGVRFADVTCGERFVIVRGGGRESPTGVMASLISLPRFGSPAIISRLAGNLPGRGFGLPLLGLVI